MIRKKNRQKLTVTPIVNKADEIKQISYAAVANIANLSSTVLTTSTAAININTAATLPLRFTFGNITYPLGNAVVTNAPIAPPENEDFSIDEENMTILAECKNHHEFSTHWEKFQEPCPICHAGIREFGVERITFRSR